MKLIKINPKHIFGHRKTRTVSRTDPPSFGSGTSSSSSSDSSDLQLSGNHKKPDKGKKINGYDTPTSVLQAAERSGTGAGAWLEISDDSYYDWVQAFKLMDKDCDGKIKTNELVALLRRVGAEPPTEEELLMMLSEIDRNGDGCISLEEFGAISSAFGPPACDSELRDAFDFFDTDHDGKITAEELHSVFTALGDVRCTLEDCTRMIGGVDKNGDGFVCFEDFTRMMVQHR